MALARRFRTFTKIFLCMVVCYYPIEAKINRNRVLKRTDEGSPEVSKVLVFH